MIAAVIGVPVLRLRGHYLAFATLALHLIAFSLLYAWDRFTGGQYGISVTKPLEVAVTCSAARHAAVVWGVVAIALLLATNLVHSRVGRALQAIATDEASAAASGVPVASYKLRLFVLAAALAGLGGGLFTFSFQFVSPEAFPIVLSIEFVVMVAVGGLGNVYGAVAGTVAILYLEQKLRELGAPGPVRLGPPRRGADGVLLRRLRPDPDRDHAVLPPRPASGDRRRERGRLGESSRVPGPRPYALSPGRRGTAFCLSTAWPNVASDARCATWRRARPVGVGASTRLASARCARRRGAHLRREPRLAESPPSMGNASCAPLRRDGWTTSRLRRTQPALNGRCGRRAPALST